jgi:hypothetical protein
VDSTTTGRSDDRQGWAPQVRLVRKLPSRRYQASYVGPDNVRHAAPSTFDAKMDAEAWLTSEYRLIETDSWVAPKTRREKLAPVTFGAYADVWLSGRDLKPRSWAPQSTTRYSPRTRATYAARGLPCARPAPNQPPSTSWPG